MCHIPTRGWTVKLYQRTENPEYAAENVRRRTFPRSCLNDNNKQKCDHDHYRYESLPHEHMF